MSDLESLAALVRTLREAGVSTYEGPVPRQGEPSQCWGTVKLTVRPPAPPPPAEKPAAKPMEERPRIPAGLGGLV